MACAGSGLTPNETTYSLRVGAGYAARSGAAPQPIGRHADSDGSDDDDICYAGTNYGRTFSAADATRALAGYTLEPVEYDDGPNVMPASLARVIGQNETSSNAILNPDGSASVTSEFVLEHTASLLSLTRTTDKTGFRLVLKPSGNPAAIFGMTEEEYNALPTDGTPTHHIKEFHLVGVENSFGHKLAIDVPSINSAYRTVKHTQAAIAHDVHISANETNGGYKHTIITGVPDAKKSEWVAKYGAISEADLRAEARELDAGIMSLPEDSPIVAKFNQDMYDAGMPHEMLQAPDGNLSKRVEMATEDWERYLGICLGLNKDLNNNFNPRNLEFHVSVWSGKHHTPSSTSDRTLKNAPAGIPWLAHIEKRMAEYDERLEVLKKPADIGVKLNSELCKAELAKIGAKSFKAVLSELTRPRTITFTAIIQHTPIKAPADDMD